ncbi:MAG: hypothetical protein LC737_05520 [Chloroflexi bacterium]|nr:hypothetical protein [Chloroflexota bacterium]
MKITLCISCILALVLLIACAAPSTPQQVALPTPTVCATRATTAVAQIQGTPVTAPTQASGQTNPVTPQAVPPTFSPDVQATMDARILQSGGSGPTYPAQTPVRGSASPCTTPTPQR